MNVERHVRAIQADLAAAAELGSEQVAEAGRRLADAVSASLQLRILDVLDEASLGLNAQLEDGHVELRLAGREPEIVFVASAPPAGAGSLGVGDGLSSRITLRLPDALKTALEAAATREAISTNAWIVRALAGALEQRAAAGRPTGNRLQGFASS